MSGAAILALGAAFCFALALILTQYGLRTVPSWRSPLWAAALVGRRTFAGGPADHAGAAVAPLVAVFPLMAVVMRYLFPREERLHAAGLFGISRQRGRRGFFVNRWNLMPAAKA